MLHVILQILAVIGIVLLCILGVIFLLVLLVLFVPVRYRAEGEKNGSGLRLLVKASYLLRIITVTYEYPQPGGVRARLFGIKVLDSTEPEKQKKRRRKGHKRADDAKESKETAAEAENTVRTQAESTASEEKEAFFLADKKAEYETTEAKNTEESRDGEKEIPKEQAEGAAEKEKLTLRGKIKKIIYTIRTFCDKIKHIKDTIKKIADNIAYYKKVITAVENQKLYGRAKDRIFRVLKSIRPRVLKAALHVGTGSPDTTGYLCAVYGMLLPVLGSHVVLDADFEEAVLEGRFFLKGRITVFTLLRHAAGVLLDKQLRIFIKQLKREA